MWEVFSLVKPLQALHRLFLLLVKGLWRVSPPSSFIVPSNTKYLTPPANRLHFSVGGDTFFKKRCIVSLLLTVGSALLVVSLIATSSSGAFILVVGLCQGVTPASTTFLLHGENAVCHRLQYLTTGRGVCLFSSLDQSAELQGVRHEINTVFPSGCLEDYVN